DQRDDRVVSNAQLAELVEQRRDDRVRERDLAVIRAVRERGTEWRRRVIRLVRIVQMQPREERRAAGPGVLLEPGGERELGAIPAALRLEADDLRLRSLHAVVVDVEPARETVAAIQDERAHELRGPVALLLQRGRERLERIRQIEVAVVPDAVFERIQPGEHLRVR